MPIILSEEIQQLIEARMKRDGFDSADAIVLALLNDSELDRDAATLAAIQRGMLDGEHGRTIPWEDFKNTWMTPKKPK